MTNAIILYTIVDNNLAKYLANVSEDKKIPCFGVLRKLDFKFFKNISIKRQPMNQAVSIY